MARIKLQLISADIPRALNHLNTWGITIYDYVPVDDITAVFSIEVSFYQTAVNLERYGCRISILHDVRVSYADVMKRRWILLVGITFLLFLTAFIPTRVLFIQVEGNNMLPDRLILEKAEECGICFGANRGAVRSERVKNQLLQLLPQLQWAGINTQGCVAIVSVQERKPEETVRPFEGIGNIVSSRDGIVQSVTVLQGSSQCKPGQAVHKGEILISGYTDCGSLIRGETPQGDVLALTNRGLTAVSPRYIQKKSTVVLEEKKYALLIGKNRINLYKDSGILDGTCDKMYLYSYLTLPGGFRLPLALICERRIVWETEPSTQSEEDTVELLNGFSTDYLQSQMIAGQILRADQMIHHREDSSVLTGSYACSEMIGQILYEERFQSNGENN